MQDDEQNIFHLSVGLNKLVSDFCLAVLAISNRFRLQVSAHAQSAPLLASEVKGTGNCRCLSTDWRQLAMLCTKCLLWAGHYSFSKSYGAKQGCRRFWGTHITVEDPYSCKSSGYMVTFEYPNSQDIIPLVQCWHGHRHYGRTTVKQL